MDKDCNKSQPSHMNYLDAQKSADRIEAALKWVARQKKQHDTLSAIRSRQSQTQLQSKKEGG